MVKGCILANSATSSSESSLLQLSLSVESLEINVATSHIGARY